LSFSGKKSRADPTALPRNSSLAIKDPSFTTTPISRSLASVNGSSEPLGSNPSISAPRLSAQPHIQQTTSLRKSSTSPIQKVATVKKPIPTTDARSAGISGPILNDGKLITKIDAAAAAMNPFNRSNRPQAVIASSSVS
jgi:hypothetical protein